MNQHLRTFLVSVISVGVGWAVSRWSQREAVEVNVSQPATAITTVETATGQRSGGVGGAASDSTAKKSGEHAKQLRTALEELDPLKRAAKYFEILANTTADNASEVREVWKEYQATGKIIWHWSH